MTEKGKQFLEAASRDEQLKKRLNMIPKSEATFAEAVAVAKEFGYDLAEEDLAPVQAAGNQARELTDHELEAVVGGLGVCVCPLAGAGAENGDEDGW